MDIRREIRFRAWNTKTKIMTSPFDWFDLKFMPSDSKFWELMQYTGLKDKKGQEIYENDIVNHSPWGVGFKHIDGTPVKLKPKQVIWDEGAWKIEKDSTFNLAIYEDIEIIGNIYENSELIK